MSKVVSVIVYHSYYGCETGCCGHRVEIKYEDGTERDVFEFEHGKGIEFAKKLVKNEFGEEHVKDLDWENCEIIDGDDCGL